MTDWATRRKLQYFWIIVGFIVLFFVIPFYIFIYQAPTCFDGLRNGGETGIDCGGSCRLLCSIEITEPISRWDPRVFRVAQGTYSAIAYLENPNVTAEVLYAPYVFKLYDKDNTLITERKGTTFIPKGATFAIFEGNFMTGERVPTRATFSFDGALTWTRNATKDPDLSVTNKALTGEETSPRVDALVKNESLDRISNVEFTAIILDGSGNAVGASRTFLEDIEKGETRPIVFTWPLPFETKAEVCESPVDVALVIDRSGSMNDLGTTPPQPLTDVKNAAVSFLNQLDKNDQGSIVSFATEASSPIDMELTSDFSKLIKSVDTISILTTGVQNTNIGDGMLKAREELLSSRHRESVGKVMIVLTDGVATHPEKKGDPTYPEKFALSIADQSRLENIGIFAIGLGKDLNIPFLKSVASSSEEFYLAPTTKDLVSIYKQIATKICKKRPAVIEIIPRFYPKTFIPKS